MLSGRPVDASVFAKLALGENGDSQSSGSDGGQDASVSDGAVDNADDDADDDDAHVFGDANTAVATSNRGRVVGTFANLADLDAVQSAAQTAYERVVADIFSTSPSDPDPDLASAAAALAGSVLENKGLVETRPTRTCDAQRRGTHRHARAEKNKAQITATTSPNARFAKLPRSCALRTHQPALARRRTSDGNTYYRCTCVSVVCRARMECVVRRAWRVRKRLRVRRV
jgi:hypothetical protein